MTPSEIAEWLEIEADTLSHVAGLAGDVPHLRQAADTIRAQAEALKIATEALEVINGERYEGDDSGAETVATQALARIKEVG